MSRIGNKPITVPEVVEVSLDGKVLGSIITVPAVAGFYLASYIINDIVNS